MRYSGLLARMAVWLTAALSGGTVLADASPQYDPKFSIGLTHPISQDGWSIPGWTVLGVSQMLTDRIIMTPVHPGSQRSAIWSEHTNPYTDWTVEIYFRAAGEANAGGSFHFWYTAGGAGYGGTDSVYTARPWDGLAILVDKWGQEGGSIRAFLNDGNTDYSIHHNVHSLAFGHCNFKYRNLGVPSKLTISHTSQGLKVLQGDRVCFETKDVRLPPASYFGVSAASADTPDTFELFSMKVSSPEQAEQQQQQARQQQQIYQQQQQQQRQEQQKQQQQQHQQQQQQQQKQDNSQNVIGEQKRGNPLPHEVDMKQFKEDIPDQPATAYKTADEQFKDLHDRLGALTHHLASIQVQIGQSYDKLDALVQKFDEQVVESRRARVPREQVDRVESRVSSLEAMLRDLERALNSKDYTGHFEALHNTIRDQHTSLLGTVPQSVAEEFRRSAPWVSWESVVVVGLGVAVAVLGTGAYRVYMLKRKAGVKKYL